MLYTKQIKMGLFRKMTAKFIGENKLKKNDGKYCKQTLDQKKSHLSNQVNKSGDEKSRIGQIVKSLSFEDLTYSSTQAENLSLQKSQKVFQGSSHVDKPANSALLAAKLKCNEWGLERLSTVSTPKKSITSRIGANPKPFQSPPFNRSKSHPSYKPNVQRSQSMKERRLALNNLRKFKSCSSTLYSIEEIDENGSY